MAPWKKALLTAVGFGFGFAVAAALIVGIWSWYRNLPVKPRPWNEKAIVASFDYATKVAADSTGKEHPTYDSMGLYYTLLNATDADYTLPTANDIVINGLLKKENSLSGGSDLLVITNAEDIFIPPRQRRRLALNLQYPLQTKEVINNDNERVVVAAFLTKTVKNLAGFVIFDKSNRYQINLPNGWITYQPSQSK